MPKPSQQFPATRWSLIHTFQQGQEELASEALADLCQLYWYPLYAHARRAGQSPEESEDLTQAFFHHLISKDVLQRVREDGRRLRSYLLKSLSNFMAASARHDRALKRGGAFSVVSFEIMDAEERYQHEATDDANPEELYDKRWALTLMHDALGRLRKQFASKGKGAQFEAIKDMLLPGAAEKSHQELAEVLGTTTANARVTLFRVRQEYGLLLRKIIADTVASPEDVDGEIAHLIQAVSA